MTLYLKNKEALKSGNFVRKIRATEEIVHDETINTAAAGRL